MKGDSAPTVTRRKPVMAVLVVAHVLSALVLVLALSQVGRLVATLVDRDARVAVALGAALVAAVVDLVAIVRARMAPGLARQTPKGVADDPGRPWWVTPLIWGGDTGIIGTTFRVSSASWLLLATAVLGLAPWWAGAAYGLAFAVPLAVVVAVGEGAPVCTLRPRLGRAAVRAAQGVGVLVLLTPLALTQ